VRGDEEKTGRRGDFGFVCVCVWCVYCVYGLVRVCALGVSSVVVGPFARCVPLVIRRKLKYQN
jgi:hypothetical protein